MSETRLSNVAMDLDGFLRTYDACEKPAWASIHVGRYPYVNDHAREHQRGRTGTGAPQNNKEEAFTSARAGPR
jgi:hypothetical protein